MRVVVYIKNGQLWKMAFREGPAASGQSGGANTRKRWYKDRKIPFEKTIEAGMGWSFRVEPEKESLYFIVYRNGLRIYRRRARLDMPAQILFPAGVAFLKQPHANAIRLATDVFEAIQPISQRLRIPFHAEVQVVGIDSGFHTRNLGDLSRVVKIRTDGEIKASPGAHEHHHLEGGTFLLRMEEESPYARHLFVAALPKYDTAKLREIVRSLA